MKTKTAVKRTMIMWGWLRDNPDKGKKDFLSTQKPKSWVAPKRAYCYLCDLYFDSDCVGCLLDLKCGVCNDEGHPYTLWCDDVGYHHNPRFAQEIIDLCQRWLDNQDKGE